MRGWLGRRFGRMRRSRAGPGRIATAVSRATEGAKGVAAALTAIGLILGSVIAWVLFAFHKMNISDVLSHM